MEDTDVGCICQHGGVGGLPSCKVVCQCHYLDFSAVQLGSVPFRPSLNYHPVLEAMTSFSLKFYTRYRKFKRPLVL